MQRIYNVDKWQELPDGSSANFGKVEPRRVRLDVNAPSRVSLFHSTGDGEVTFLASVHGRDVIEFHTNMEFAITVDGGPVWLFTIDGEDVSFEPSSAPILTKIADRRPRNPEFELMQYHANRNIERRMEQMRRELDAEWARRITPEPALAAKPAAKGGGDGGVKQPEPPAAGDAGAAVAEPADAGSGKGDAKK